jgi:hypothetical protein
MRRPLKTLYVTGAVAGADVWVYGCEAETLARGYTL